MSIKIHFNYNILFAFSQAVRRKILRYFKNIGRMGNVSIFIALDGIVKVWYTENGNITEIANASGVIQNKYWYDDLGQLTREDNNVTGESDVVIRMDSGRIVS